MTGGQVVDTPAVREFLDRALEKVSREQCRAIAAECAGKARLIQGVLATGRATGFDQAAVHTLLRCIFSTRRRTDAVISAASAPGGLGAALTGLCWDEAPLERRFDDFVARLSPLDDVELACDLAGEVLHHLHPDRYWLFSRWMWSPRLGTGAVALVTTEADLTGETPGASYLKLGRALLMLRASGDAAGLLDLGEEPWNLDVLLACVYCVYLYTITRLRMTQEFNKVIPPLPELVRRILGVHRLETLEA
ncbi:MAG TPA: hypothetical protein VH134_13050 [Candidatus Dormibacteraeota bacterium]|nr:hypothetical protein [Candidatus Dormibacteraeota bacterium]